MTRKIGRYEILGPLATGGMAEILLARLVGPSGFERPVVIKRIRQDLDHEELVELFLEEARLAAKVRHANVVAVEDLGTDEGAPYLVMEYLEGESLSNVTRRLMTREESIPFGLIAFIVAEACAGLHAAHELRDADGEPLHIVHRDVSPQNVFVTYDGAIKVVDFGIARSQGSPRTEPGAVRGKFGYMAPEQLKGEPVDRRTDVFTLGIVLYECLTGHRLFKRFNAMGTMRAVVSDPIVAPRRVNPKVPPALEAICMRALARPPEDRFATAGEMRRELLVAMRGLVSEEPSAELAELMVRAFPDRIGDKRVLLRNVREGSVVDHIPVGDVDVSIDFPGIEDVPDGADWGPPLEQESGHGPPPSVRRSAHPTTGTMATPVGPSAVEIRLTSPRRSRALGFVALIVVLTACLVVSMRIVRKTPATTTPSPPQTPPPPASLATTAAIPQPTVEPIGSARPEPPPSAAAAPSAVHSTPASGNRRPRPPLTATAGLPNASGSAPAPVETATAAPSASSRGFRRFP